jgi:hypothetical protein
MGFKIDAVRHVSIFCRNVPKQKYLAEIKNNPPHHWWLCISVAIGGVDSQT